MPEQDSLDLSRFTVVQDGVGGDEEIVRWSNVTEGSAIRSLDLVVTFTPVEDFDDIDYGISSGLGWYHDGTYSDESLTGNELSDLSGL